MFQFPFFKNKVFWILSILHILTIISLFLILIFLKKDYFFILLEDDGYYNIAKEIMEGRAPIYNRVGPGLPIIYTFIHLFPKDFHPFAQLLLSIIASLGVIGICLKIANSYLSQREMLIGGLIFIFNPVYFHWTFKSRPEIYLALLLGLFILFFIKFSRSRKGKWFIYSVIVFAISIFIKPTFILIPFFILALAIYRKEKHAIVGGILLLIINIGLYFLYDSIVGGNSKNNRSELVHSYGKTELIYNIYWTNYIIKTKQFRKGTVNKYNHPDNIKEIFKAEKIGNYNLQKPFGSQWINNYSKKKPRANYFKMNLDFIRDNPKLFLQKILLSPFFYVGLAARVYETFIKLIYSVLAIFFSICSIKKLLRLKKDLSKDISIVICSVIGYAFLHFLLHAFNRYSLPILPYLTVWSGNFVYLNFKKMRLKKKLNPVLKGLTTFQ